MTRKERLAIPPLRYYTRQHHTRAQLMHLMLDPAPPPEKRVEWWGWWRHLRVSLRGTGRSMGVAVP